jgi:hypothetical protein
LDDVDDSYLPFLDDFETEGSADHDQSEKKASSDYGSVPESEDFPSLSNFLTMQPQPPAGSIEAEEPQEFESDADPECGGERMESPAEEDAGALENIGISDDVSGTPGSGAGGGKCGSSLYSTNATSTLLTVSPAAFTQGAVPLSMNTDSDSLFCSSGKRSHAPSSSKRSRDEECIGNKEAVYGTPTKKPRILAQEMTSPLRQGCGIDPPRADANSSIGVVSKGEHPHKDPGDKENACNDIDLSLLDEYKDFVNFL